MPWYVIAYIALLVIIAGIGTFDNYRSGRSKLYLMVDSGDHAIWIYFCFAYYYPSSAAPLGRLIVVPMAFAVYWEIMDAWKQVRMIQEARVDDPELEELSPGANLLVDRAVEAAGVLFGVLLVTPAAILSVRVIQRAW